MDNKKFEELVELYINEANEEQARALFHDIIVEKSREIYESMMDESDQVGDLMGEIESEEEGMAEGEDEFSGDLEPVEGGDEGEFDPEAEFADADAEVGADEFEPSAEEGEEDIEDRVVDLEDKLDELMAEFEALMADEEGEADAGAEDLDSEADVGAEDLEGAEGAEDEELQEAIQMKKVSVTHGDNGVQTKSPVAANSGKAGMASKPVAASTADEKGRTAPSVKPLGQSFKNAPGAAGGKTESAPKPTTAQASGVNTKSPVSESRKLAAKPVTKPVAKPVAKAKK